MTSVGNSDITNHKSAKLYNLDVLLAVGYRVKSKRGILFRRWATAVLRDYLIKGYSLSSDRVIVTNENYIQLINDVNHLKKDVEDIKAIVNRNVLDSIIIYEGDSFDGFSFINDLIKKAIESVIIIDGYADDSLFDFLIGSKKGINKVVICHKANRISKEINFKYIDLLPTFWRNKVGNKIGNNNEVTRKHGLNLSREKILYEIKT